MGVEFIIKAIKALNDVDCTIFKITLRSPDLNPVEDVFHVV